MGDDPNQAGNSRRWILREVEASLKRLQTDWIDLYQVHRWDPWTDHEETLGALSDLVPQGKVRYIGSSTYPAAQIVKAQWVARERGLQRFVCEQPPYSILARGIEADVLPACREHGMGVIPWSPLAGGWLSGKWRKGADDLTSRRSAMIPARYDLSIPENQAKLDAADALGQLADEAGISLIHMALAFVIRHPAVTAAIIGPRTMEQLESQLGAAEVELDDAVLDRIDEIVAPGTTINPLDAGWTNPALAPTRGAANRSTRQRANGLPQSVGDVRGAPSDADQRPGGGGLGADRRPWELSGVGRRRGRRDRPADDRARRHFRADGPPADRKADRHHFRGRPAAGPARDQAALPHQRLLLALDSSRRPRASASPRSSWAWSPPRCATARSTRRSASGSTGAPCWRRSTACARPLRGDSPPRRA